MRAQPTMHQALVKSSAAWMKNSRPCTLRVPPTRRSDGPMHCSGSRCCPRGVHPGTCTRSQHLFSSSSGRDHTADDSRRGRKQARGQRQRRCPRAAARRAHLWQRRALDKVVELPAGVPRLQLHHLQRAVLQEEVHLVGAARRGRALGLPRRVVPARPVAQHAVVAFQKLLQLVGGGRAAEQRLGKPAGALGVAARQACTGGGGASNTPECISSCCLPRPSLFWLGPLGTHTRGGAAVRRQPPRDTTVEGASSWGLQKHGAAPPSNAHPRACCVAPCTAQ